MQPLFYSMQDAAAANEACNGGSGGGEGVRGGGGGGEGVRGGGWRRVGYDIVYFQCPRHGYVALNSSADYYTLSWKMASCIPACCMVL